MELTDVELCSRYRQGDHAVAAVLLSRHTGLIHSLIKKIVRPQFAPVEDLRQAGRLAILRAAAAFEDHRGVKFSTYASTAIRNSITREIHDHRRWLNRNGSMDEIEVTTPDREESLPDVDLQAVTPMQRMIVRRRYGMDCKTMTFYEIAAALEITPHYVMSQHDQALATLRDRCQPLESFAA